MKKEDVVGVAVVLQYLSEGVHKTKHMHVGVDESTVRCVVSFGPFTLGADNCRKKVNIASN